MKKLLFIVFISALQCFSSLYAQNTKKAVYSPEVILKNLNNAENYPYHLMLSADFIAYDTAEKIITKREFLKTISSGGYLPLWLNSGDSLLHYKLYKLKPGTDSRIFKIYKELGDNYYAQYKREGENFPEFNYVDLNGNIYNSTNTKGKILVFDCWFVACSSCVAGMPQLNKILQQYKNRKDILFIGLDNDLKFNAVHFLKTTRFDFAIVPLPDDYFSNTLKVSSFPTSFIVNKDGMISKVVNSPKELAAALKREAAK